MAKCNTPGKGIYLLLTVILVFSPYQFPYTFSKEASYSPPKSLKWVPCPSHSREPEAKCGEIKVSVDKHKPTLGKISLGFVKLPASIPQQKKGTIFINPGGPGISAVASILFGQLKTYPEWEEMRKYFDFIGFDPRGVGVSSPIDCGSNSFHDNHLSINYPTNLNTFQLIKKVNRQIGQQCLQKNPLLPYMDTLHAADDLDFLREQLGLQTIDFYGVSYGTLLGQTYALKYPTRVNKMILDGVIDHSITLKSSALMEGMALETVLRKMDDWCSTKSECEIREEGVKNSVKNIIYGLNAQNIILDETNYPGVFPRRETIDAGVFMHYLYTRLYSDIQWYEVMHTLKQLSLLQHKKIKKLTKSTAILLFENTRTYFDPGYTAVNCLDYNSDLKNIPTIARDLNQLKLVSPLFWRANQNWDMDIFCLGWPLPAANPVADYHLHTPQPILYSNPIFDAITPMSQAVTAASKSDKAIISFSDATGHSNANNSSCGRQIQLDYLLGKPLPPSGSICHSF